MPNDKSPGNNSFTKELTKTFQSEVKKNILILYFTLFW